MKMTNFFKMALMGIFAAGVFTACGGDDDNPNPNPNPGGGDDPKTAPTITLTGAQTSGSESSSLTFKLTLKNAESAKYLTVPTSELNNHIIEKAPASQRNYAIRLLKLFIAATGNSST